MTQRLEYIDLGKAIAIISVVIGHVLLFDLYGTDNIRRSDLMSCVSSYENNLFIFLSGIVSVTFIQIESILYDLYKRFRGLIIPALIVGIPYAYYIGTDIERFFLDVSKLGYWYLFVLFALYILNYPFALLQSKYLKYVYVLIIPLWVFIYRHTYIIPTKINDLLDIDSIVGYFPYFFVGAIIKRHKLHEQIFSKPVLLVCILIIAFRCQIEYYTRNYMFLLHHNTFVHFAEVISIVTICKLGGGRIPIAIHNSLTFIGRNTIFIYLFHYYVIYTVMMPFMYDWFGNNGNIGIDLLSVIIPTIVAVVFSLFIKRLFEYSPRLMKIIFYKR